MSDDTVLVDEFSAAADFAHIARSLQAHATAGSTLQAVCDLVVRVVRGDGAGFTTVRGGRFSTDASTGSLPLAVDEIQYQVREGPCVDALVKEEMFHTGDLAAEHRWPKFAPLAVEGTGVRSMISHRVFLEEDSLGALNVYSREVDAFTEADVQTSGIFATHAAVALQAARDHDRMKHLEAAFLSNRRIGTAIGILMARQGLTEQRAFDLLREASQHDNRKVAEIAEDVIYTGDLPH